MTGRGTAAALPDGHPNRVAIQRTAKPDPGTVVLRRRPALHHLQGRIDEEPEGRPAVHPARTGGRPGHTSRPRPPRPRCSPCPTKPTWPGCCGPTWPTPGGHGWPRRRTIPQEYARGNKATSWQPSTTTARVLDFHSLRHTCGAWLAMAGVHPKVVQPVMRHSSITLTMDTYGHLFPGQEADAVARMRHMVEDRRQRSPAGNRDRQTTADSPAAGQVRRRSSQRKTRANEAAACEANAAT